MTFKGIQPNDTIEFLQPNGIGRNGPEVKRARGRAVLCFPSHVVLNIGGRHGTPAVVTDDNFVAVVRRKS